MRTQPYIVGRAKPLIGVFALPVLAGSGTDFAGRDIGNKRIYRVSDVHTGDDIVTSIAMETGYHVRSY